MALKLLLLDIETAPHKAYVWGLYDQNVGISQIMEPGYTICWAAKWHGRPEIMFGSVHRDGARKMTRGIHALLDEADAVIHFNGRKFDIPTLNKEFLLHGLKPPSPFRHIDLYTTCRRKFRFASNKLDFVSRILGIGAKVQHKGMDLWHGCLAGDDASWKIMERYNKGDVKLTERLYDKLLPWIDGHPSHALFGDDPKVCTNCNSGALQARGYAFTTSYRYKRFQCTKCGKWLRSTRCEPVRIPELKAV